MGLSINEVALLRWSGGCPKRDDSTDRLREWDSDNGKEGVKKRDVIDGWSLPSRPPLLG